jgi:1-acyl-sn-glycerol-3-phosphate acyltransferase
MENRPAKHQASIGTALGSALLWVAGTLFFACCAIVLSISLYIASREKALALARILFAVQLKIMGIRLQVTGREYLIADRPCVVMGNHQSLFDIFVIPVAVPLYYVGIEAAYHFSLPLWGRLITRYGNIPIQRRNLKRAIDSIAMARQTLESGTSIIVLPEGHRTRTGRIGPFKKGPFHLARQTQAPILPFAICGLYDYNKKGSWRLRPGRVTVHIGQPITFDQYAHLSTDQLCRHVRKIVMQLAGQTR